MAAAWQEQAVRLVAQSVMTTSRRMLAWGAAM